MRIGGAVAKQNEDDVAAEQPRCGEDDRVERRLRVGRRLADDAQDFGNRGSLRNGLVALGGIRLNEPLLRGDFPAKLGRFKVPLDFFSCQIGDSGKNGRARMSGIAGISPDSSV